MYIHLGCANSLHHVTGYKHLNRCRICDFFPLKCTLAKTSHLAIATGVSCICVTQKALI